MAFPATVNPTSYGWIGVDLDGTLAHYDTWKGPEHIGDPIPLMAERVRRWLSDGKDVRIFTARVSEMAAARNGLTVADVREIVQAWTEQHFGVKLPVVCEKDMAMIELWDDRCVQVIPNTGETIYGRYQELLSKVYVD